MLITTMFAMALVAAPAPVDVKAARTAYSGCLRAFTDKSIADKMTLDAFKAAMADQCKAEAEDYRLATLANDRKFGMSAKESQANYEQDIADYHAQFVDYFEAAGGK